MIVILLCYNDNHRKKIQIIDFAGMKSDWDGWSKNFLARAKHKGYKKLLTGKGDHVGVDKILTQDEYNLAVAGNSEQDKAIVTVRQMIKMAYENVIL